MAEKGRVPTAKKHHKVRDYQGKVSGEEIDAAGFINEARKLQEEIRKSKVAKLDPLKAKRVWLSKLNPH